MRDLTAELLTKICRDVTVEPALTHLTSETFALKSTIADDDARCGVARHFRRKGFQPIGQKLLKTVFSSNIKYD